MRHTCTEPSCARHTAHTFYCGHFKFLPTQPQYIARRAATRISPFVSVQTFHQHFFQMPCHGSMPILFRFILIHSLCSRCLWSFSFMLDDALLVLWPPFEPTSASMQANCAHLAALPLVPRSRGTQWASFPQLSKLHASFRWSRMW